MNFIRWVWMVPVVCLLGCSMHPRPPRARSLFNGRNLSGWIVHHGGQWDVQEGVLTAHHGVDWSTNPEKSGSWLATSREYGNFILELEYSVNKGGNSGIMIRSSLERNPAFTGHEVQILDDHGREPKTWTTGALYDVVAPRENRSRPAGEWNTLRIEAVGLRIRVQLNGGEIVDYPSARSLRGHVGLQNHDDKAVTKFRNIRITEL